MKTKPAPATATEAMRRATLKVAKLRRIFEAEEKLADAAKARFKSAKKTWKLARKTARRSAKKLKHAEKQIAALKKEFKPAKVKREKKHNKRSIATRPASSVGKNRRRRRVSGPGSVSPAASASLPPGTAATPV